MVVTSLLYIQVYIWVYQYHLSQYWDYWGFNFYSPGIGLATITWLAAIIPSIWLPIHITRPSQVIYWSLYLVCYIPALFSPVFMKYCQSDELMTLVISLFIGFTLIEIPYHIALPKPIKINISSKTFHIIFWGITSLFFADILFVYWGNFQLVSFSDVYDIRFSGGELAQKYFVAYAVIISAGCLMPFLLAWSIFLKKTLFTLIASAGLVILYSTAGNKMMLFFILIILSLHWFFNKDLKNFGPTFLVYLLLLWSFLLIISEIEAVRSVMMLVIGLLFMRTLGNSGLTTAQYHAFFLTHPQTHYSHINVMRLFMKYPYQEQLGLEIGYYFMGDPDLNLNAIFWATDGLAAFGVWGIPIICFVVGWVFWLLDACSQKHNLKFVAMAILPAGMNLLNMSLFTTLLTGGLGLCMLLFYILPSTKTTTD